jgi:hypothetical protein
MASKKRIVLDLNAKVKVVEAREKDKRTVKQTVGKSEIGKNTSLRHFDIEIGHKTRVVDW